MARTFGEGLTAGLQSIEGSLAKRDARQMNEYKKRLLQKQVEAMDTPGLVYSPKGYFNPEVEKAKQNIAVEAMRNYMGGGVEQSQPTTQPPTLGPSLSVNGQPQEQSQAPKPSQFLKAKIFSGGKPGVREVLNPEWKAYVSNSMKKKQEVDKRKLESDVATAEIDSMVSNLASNLKSSNIETGGAGPIRGLIGRGLAKMGAPNTENIVGVKGTIRDTAIKLAQRLSGGNRAIATLFQNVLSSIPSDVRTPEQQMTTLHDLYLTAHSLKKAMDSFGPDVLLTQAESGTFSPAALNQEEISNLGNQYSNLIKLSKPRPEVSETGEFREPKTTSFLSPFSKYSNNNESIKSKKTKIHGYDVEVS